MRAFLAGHNSLHEQISKHRTPQNPFGDAKPREAILAAKTGRTEEEIVREEASKTKIHVCVVSTSCVLATSSPTAGAPDTRAA